MATLTLRLTKGAPLTYAEADDNWSDINAEVAGKADASHTHTAAAVTDFAEAVDDRVAALLTAGSNITLTYDDVAGTLTIDAAGGGAGTDLAYTASTRVLASSTGDDVTLPLVASADAGLAPASGGGTSNFLRADGTWAAPGGGSSVYLARVAADINLTNDTSRQKLFDVSANGALTLDAGEYRFNTLLYFTGMSATVGNAEFSLLGAGTAVLTNIMYQSAGNDANGPLQTGARNGRGSITEASGQGILANATGTGLFVEIAGYFSVTTGGTIIPSITAGATPTAFTLKLGSSFFATQISPTAGATLGTWT